MKNYLFVWNKYLSKNGWFKNQIYVLGSVTYKQLKCIVKISVLIFSSLFSVTYTYLNVLFWYASSLVNCVLSGT